MQRRDNYRIQADQAKARFLTYDQDTLIRKCGLTADDRYLYTRLLDRPLRIDRRSGDLEVREGAHWLDANTYHAVMTVLDWLTNPWEPYKRGIMIGFDSSMDYAWIYRSILESVALTLKNNYDNMCNEMNHFAKHVIITGGGSNSDLFMQIFADVFNLPARRNAINGCASLGAAINTAVGLGLYPDYATAVDKMVRVKDIFIPIESNAKRYDAMNKGIFKDLTKHTDVILKKSYEVMHGELGNVDSIQSWSNA